MQPSILNRSVCVRIIIVRILGRPYHNKISSNNVGLQLSQINVPPENLGYKTGPSVAITGSLSDVVIIRASPIHRPVLHTCNEMLALTQAYGDRNVSICVTKRTQRGAYTRTGLCVALMLLTDVVGICEL